MDDSFERILEAIRDSGIREEVAFLNAVLPILAGLIVDLHTGEIVFATRRLEAMFGYQIRGELVGKQLEVLLPPAYRDAHRSHRAAFLRTPSARLMRGQEFSAYSSTGEHFAVEVALSEAFAYHGRECSAAIVLDQRARA